MSIKEIIFRVFFSSLLIVMTVMVTPSTSWAQTSNTEQTINTSSSVQVDFFDRLQELSIGQKPSLELLDQASDKGMNDDGAFYVYESSRYSMPHVIRLDDEGKIIFQELTIPSALLAEYKNTYQELGPPETFSDKTRSESLAGFPSKGVGYIIDGYLGGPIRYQRFPPKETNDFLSTNAKNYQPVDERTPASAAPEAGTNKPNVWNNWENAALLAIGLLVGGVGLFLIQKNRRL